MARVDVRVQQLELLVEAACRYGVVMELLLTIREMYNGNELEADASELIESASVAALLAKAERLNQGIDAQ